MSVQEQMILSIIALTIGAVDGVSILTVTMDMRFDETKYGISAYVPFLEDQYDIAIPVEDLMDVQTVGDAVTYISMRLQEQADRKV